VGNRRTEITTSSIGRRLPGIHWLVAISILLIGVGGIAAARYITHEIDKNTAHNEVALERSRLIEADAKLIADQVLPVFKSLHSLDVAVTRHVVEFELYVLDSDRDPDFLRESLSVLETAFSSFPEHTHYLASFDLERVTQTLGIFVDITHEALEVRSPNQLRQLLQDSEDVFVEYRALLSDTRGMLDDAVSRLGTGITQDLRNARVNVSLQQDMLERLENVSIWSLSLLILFVVLVTFLLFQSLQRRLGAVAKYAHSIAAGKYSSAITFTSPDKIGEMAESVSHMGSSMAVLVEESRSMAETARRAERATRRLAYYDSLTGLPNRQHFTDKLESALEDAARLGEKVAVVYMDLDEFKKINDSYGHTTGDQLLCAVAGRLAHCVREGDSIARSVGDSPAVLPSRLGGDEFTFLINRLHERDEAESIARRILGTLVEPYHLGEREISITPSMGLALFPDDGITGGELMKNADMAMYQAKESGRNTIKFFSSEISERQVRKLSLERDLAKALEREELSVHYQPKVDLNSRRIVGGEALLRWNHPRRGMVSPAEFIPLAEESGAIVPIGEWVLNHVCRQLVRWQSENVAPVPIAVNVSARQFARGGLLSVVSDCMGIADVCRGNIELELTESVVMNDMAFAVDVLNKLEKIGVKVSLDDFGTGYSSLSYLKRFPLSTLKIDRSFVRDIESDAEDAAIVKAIIALSKSLGIKVIAEGVENELQAGFLRKHGCNEAQGYLFSKPMPADEFTALLAQGAAVSVA